MPPGIASVFVYASMLYVAFRRPVAPPDRRDQRPFALYPLTTLFSYNARQAAHGTVRSPEEESP